MIYFRDRRLLTARCLLCHRRVFRWLHLHGPAELW